MRTLGEILDLPGSGGVQRWESHRPVADIAGTAARAGWQFGHVDGSAAHTKRQVLIAIGEALGFGDYYGANLDALADCLGDLVAASGPRILLLWDHSDTLARSDRQAFDVLVEILGGYAESGSRPLTVLLRGESAEPN